MQSKETPENPCGDLEEWFMLFLAEED